MKLLAIDKGNSRTKVGLQNNDGAIEMAVFANDAENDLLHYIKNSQFDASIMSSVAAINFKTLSDFLHSTGKLLMLDSDSKLPVKNKYATPETLGADRIAGAVGAWSLVGNKDVLLMDAGTCINYECVINDTYVGGAISPGLNLRLKAMHDYTGKLPMLSLPNEEVLFLGNSTSSCMLSGVVHGTANELRGTAAHYKAQFPQISVVLGGGDAPFLGKYLKNSIFATHQEVVLVGLIEILKYNLNDFA